MPPGCRSARHDLSHFGLRTLHDDGVHLPGRHPLDPARFYNSAGFSDEYSHVFLATDLRPVDIVPHGVEEEWMTIERVALDDVPGLIAAGEIEDAKTVIGLLAALRHLGR